MVKMLPFILMEVPNSCCMCRIECSDPKILWGSGGGMGRKIKDLLNYKMFVKYIGVIFLVYEVFVICPLWSIDR